MDLRSSYPYWLLKDGIIHTYPSIEKDCRADVAVIGAGITGALVSYALAREGKKVVVVDRRHAGMGSTAASTGLVQYEIDTPLYQLCEKIGSKKALRSYRLCREALFKLDTLAQQLASTHDLHWCPSLQFASSPDHVRGLRKEFELRRAEGIADVKWLLQCDIEKWYGFSAPCGILSEEGLQVNAYGLVHAIFHEGISNYGLQVYDSTNVTDVASEKNKITLTTSYRRKIVASHLVVCTGYESAAFGAPRVEKRFSTYAIVSEPLPQKEEIWYRNSLIWETARPYLYMCVTKSNRILVGGRDDTFYNPKKRDQNLSIKSSHLKKDFNKLFPAISFRTDFKWSGTFCSTKYGLPFIGSLSHEPRIFYALGYGGNGITFSQIAADIIKDEILGKKNKDGELFKFGR